MQAEEIRLKVKEVIANVTSIPIAEIDDNASFVGDLELDSLTLLEIGVTVDYEFRLQLPDEALQELETVEQAVELVQERLAGVVAEVEVA